MSEWEEIMANAQHGKHPQFSACVTDNSADASVAEENEDAGSDDGWDAAFAAKAF